MKILRTAQGKEFDIIWDGVATIDLALRFAVVNASMEEVLQVFTAAEETQTLTRVEDDLESVYQGYNRFRGVDQKPDGEIVVTLVEA